MMDMLTGNWESLGNYWGMGLILMMLVWLLVVLIIAALFKWLATPHQSGCSGCKKDVIDILRERYAKGEINKKEFDAKKKDLAKK